MAEKILVVDDEREIADLVTLYLKNEGYETRVCYNGQEALEQIQAGPVDLAILDVMLPEISGFELCRRIRERYQYPVIMLTAKGEELDKINGLSLGADDYVTKPFLPLELVARVKAQLRRYKRYNGEFLQKEPLTCGGLVIDVETHQASLNGAPLSLTPTEFSLLAVLCENKGKVVSSEELFRRVWGRTTTPRTTTPSLCTSGIFGKSWGIPSSAPNTSKPCGGLAMKWTRKYGPLAAGCLSLLIVSLVLYFLLDTVFNGVFVDWVESTFMLTWEEYVPSAGTYGIVQHINWHWVKPFLLGVLVVNGLLWAGAVFLTRQLARRKKEQEDVRDIAERLRQALDSDGDASQVFPPQQQEIAAQVAEWKSKLQRREQALQQETARKNDLITYLAHDLKTPLTSVIGYLSLLDEVPDMPQPQREKYTHIALEKSQRLEGLINEFFDITRYNLQQLTLEKEPVDVSYLLVQLTDEFYPLLQAHGNTIELNVPQDLTVEGDAGKLARVFNNLLKNAVSYSTPGTPILLWAEQADEQAQFFVQNRGKTIPAHQLDALFEKFFRLDEARSTATGGAGLGLAIAKEIVTLHGGSISAHSEQGVTTFTVELPTKKSL